MQVSLGSWTLEYDREAKRQGWSLFESMGIITIQKMDDSEPGDVSLKSDEEAIQVVFQQAAKGNEGALMALYLDGRVAFADEDPETYAVYEFPVVDLDTLEPGLIHLKMTVDITYKSNGVSASVLEDYLYGAMHDAFSRGQITGDTPAEVEVHQTKVVRCS